MLLGKCLAKTEMINKTNSPGMNVFLHCKIVGECAIEIHNQLTEQCNISVLGGKDNIAYIGLISALHDIGKVSPTFQYKIYNAINDRNSHKILESYPNASNEMYKHNVISGIHISQLKRRYKQLKPYSKLLKRLAMSLDRHHGSNSVDSTQSNEITSIGDYASSWNKSRDELIIRLYNYFIGNENNIVTIMADICDHISGFSDDDFMSLSGLMTVSDWIGSSIDTTYLKMPSLNNTIKGKAINKVLESGFVGFSIVNNLSFKDIYNFETRPIQQELINLIEINGANKVYSLEAPMGIGKTEAALFAAYKLISQNDASGIYFAMPTMVTSDKIHERVNNEFLNKCFNDYHSEATINHSNASLSAWGAEALPGNSWFDGSKRRLLSPFGVGTVDQILMMSINVKHSFVKSFALVNKVIIIDEVHSYDAYTNYLLEKSIEMLINNGCTVILLSATMTTDLRKQLLKCDIKSNAYPLISCSSGEYTDGTIDLSKNKDIEIKRTKSMIAFDRAIESYNNGELVLWIENDVRTSQDIYESFLNKGILECDLGLIHSQYTQKERQIRETHWVNEYGKNGSRTRGRILIGTQVLEQSLDIDADLLITRICPIDSLLQRIGRLWRHERERKSNSAMCYVIDAVPEFGTRYGISQMIYPEYILEKTSNNLPSKVILPKDIRSLINKTYSRNNLTDSEKSLLDIYDTNVNELVTEAKKSKTRNGKLYIDENAPTRYNNVPQLKIIIATDITINEDVNTITLLDGSIVNVYKKGYQRNAKQHCINIQNNTAKISLDQTLKSEIGELPDISEIFGKLVYPDNLTIILIYKNNSLYLLDNPSEPLLYLEYNCLTGIRKIRNEL
jgi:CRISPR-associated endonuclease/helicase Cas3